VLCMRTAKAFAVIAVAPTRAMTCGADDDDAGAPLPHAAQSNTAERTMRRRTRLSLVSAARGTGLRNLAGREAGAKAR
jgi:hypothetical protein